MKVSPRFFFHIVEKDIARIPLEIKLVIFALFLYSLAWGILEPLESIYFQSFVSSYFEVGILFTIINVILLLLSVPVGALSDKVNATKLILSGMLVYPTIGVLYFFANSAILVGARVLNGIGASFVWISGESFIRKESPENKTAETFGFYSTATNLALMLGAIIGAGLIVFFSIRQLFLLLCIVPIIASFFVFKAKKIHEQEETIEQGIEEVIEKDKVFVKELKDFFALGFPAIYCFIIAAFAGLFYQLMVMMVPLTAQEIHISLTDTLLLYALAHIPLLFGFFFSELADRVGKINFMVLGFLIIAIALPMVFFFPGNTTVFTITSIVFGLCIAMIGPCLNGYVTDITPKSESGEVTGTLNAAYYFGAAIGPIFFGAIADKFSLQTSFLAAGIIASWLAITTFVLKGFLKTKKQNCQVS